MNQRLVLMMKTNLKARKTLSVREYSILQQDNPMNITIIAHGIFEYGPHIPIFFQLVVSDKKTYFGTMCNYWF